MKRHSGDPGLEKALAQINAQEDANGAPAENTLESGKPKPKSKKSKRGRPAKTDKSIYGQVPTMPAKKKSSTMRSSRAKRESQLKQEADDQDDVQSNDGMCGDSPRHGDLRMLPTPRSQGPS